MIDRHGLPAQGLRTAARVARRNSLRLARVRRALASPPLSRRLPQARSILDALDTVLASLPAAVRGRVLYGPDVRGFLAETETWIGIARLAARIAGGLGGRRALVELFDRLSRTDHLATLVPSGRIDPGFPVRSMRFSTGRLRESSTDIAALLVGLRLAFPSSGSLRVRLEFREDAEQGRPRHRIDLGTMAGPAGPLAIVSAGARVAGRTGSPRYVQASLAGRTLVLGSAGRDETVLAAAGSPLRFADWPQRRSGSRFAGGGAEGSFLLVRRETIPGTSILLGNLVDHRGRPPVVGRQMKALGPRLARALRIVQIAWPAGHREVLARTCMVVPMSEPGTVSYSLPSRPGVTFVNVFGKTLLDLADDLLHETAHHRLHDLQEVEVLLRRGATTAEVQAFDSPWRGTKRPLHGLLHGTYTFLFRAELFRRVLRAALDHPRLLGPLLGRRRPRWIRRELRREIVMLSRALRDLERAGRVGLLTPAGRRLLRSMRSWFARLA